MSRPPHLRRSRLCPQSQRGIQQRREDGAHIDVAVTKRFLTGDYLMSQQQETRVDCRHHCFACGILPKLKDLRRETPPEAWECPPVTRVAERKRVIELPVIG